MRVNSVAISILVLLSVSALDPVLEFSSCNGKFAQPDLIELRDADGVVRIRIDPAGLVLRSSLDPGGLVRMSPAPHVSSELGVQPLYWSRPGSNQAVVTGGSVVGAGWKNGRSYVTLHQKALRILTRGTEWVVDTGNVQDGLGSRMMGSGRNFEFGIVSGNDFAALFGGSNGALWKSECTAGAPEGMSAVWHGRLRGTAIDASRFLSAKGCELTAQGYTVPGMVKRNGNQLWLPLMRMAPRRVARRVMVPCEVSIEGERR